MKKYLKNSIPILSVLFCSLFFLTSLDNKVYDAFLRTIPSLQESDSVLLIDIEDVSIENVGIFPWTRDIMADAIVFLREMGAQSVIFDLSYLDKSPVKVDPVYVKEELPAYLDYGFKQIDDTLSQVLDAITQNVISRSEIPSYKDQLIEFNQGVRNSLDASISYVTRDVDEFFANTLSFFGESYLTLTMVAEASIIDDDKTFDMSDKNLPWLEENIALKNVTAINDTLTPEHIGIIPAIHTLLSRARGAGFVNADPDTDGYRRRVHLLIKHNGKYYGQLTFVPLLNKIGNPEIIVSNSTIILKKAIINGKETDIKIPRAQDGTVLIKWPKKQFDGYNKIIAWNLIANNKLEAALIKNLSAMQDSGFFTYWEEDQTPLDHYNNAAYIREQLYQGEDIDAGISFETYITFRNNFIESTQLFLSDEYESRIYANIDENDLETREYVHGFFQNARTQFGDLLTIRTNAAEKVLGAFCVIGVSATSGTDEGLTTYQERFPNVGIHTTVANMILANEFLDDSPNLISFFIALVLSIALGLIIQKLDIKQSLVAGVITLVGSVLTLLLFFMLTRRYIGVVVPFASVSLTFLSLSSMNFLTTIREKSFLRSAFSRYLSPEVINEIINDPSKLNLGGEKREMTAIFTDIKGFSTISEQMDPADLVNLLNLYLTAMSNIVLENRGTIDKYEGDAIIAFFGAPIYMGDHAALACRTAIRMKKAEIELNKKILAENLSPSPLLTRIGINTGDMVVGNMGTPTKMDYTIMGNAVNLAARLEGVNKQYNTKGILISEYTRGQIGQEFLVRRLDRVRVVGVNTPLRLYELLGEQREMSEEVISLVARWEKAIDLYESRKFTEAQGIFKEISTEDEIDQVAKLYIERCSGFIAEPPENWDGIFNLLQK